MAKTAFQKPKELLVLSLFDGMSCGEIALQKLGIKVKQYYAAEIDKHAIQVTQHNFPDTIQLGDVTKVFAKNLPKIDLLIGGSPCQGFSFAGKQLAFDDPRSKLFFEFVRLKNECNPTYFMLENVKMKKEYEVIISKYMGVAPIEINSALVSAQNRIRLYWTNIGVEPQGLFGDMQCMIPQPKDKGIILRDILETNVPDKYYLSDKMLKYFSNRAANFNQGKVNVRNENGKASTITSSSSSVDISDNFVCIDTNGRIDTDKTGTIPASYSQGPDNYSSRPFILNTNLKPANQDKANCFTAGGNSGGLHSDMTLIVASRGRNPENPKSREIGLNTEQHLEPRFDGKTNCLTSVQKDNLVMLNERQKANHKNGDEKANTFLSTSWKGSQANGMTLVGTTKIRRLTPTECERLQTVPDGYTSCVSDTQRYRMLGNGWTVDVIAHIFSFMALQKPKSDGEKIIKTA
jgi:DNA-cytosine methyltransferase